MSIFGGATTEGLEEVQDRIGGAVIRDTDAYDAKVKLAYAGQSDGGAKNITWVFEMPDGQEYRETIYWTNKKGENWFKNKQDPSKKVPLPGFTVCDDLCLATTGKPLAEQETEEKQVLIYDFDQKKELPKAAHVLIDTLDQPVTLGLVRQTVNKNVKQGNEYVPGPDSKDENIIEKVFHTETKLTMVEAKQQAETAAFYPSWVERNKGNTKDRRKNKDGSSGGTAGAPGGPPQAGSAPAPKTSLFGKK